MRGFAAGLPGCPEQEPRGGRSGLRGSRRLYPHAGSHQPEGDLNPPHNPEGPPTSRACPQQPPPPGRALQPPQSRQHSPRTAPRQRPPPWTCSPRSCHPVGASPRPSLSSSPLPGARPPRGGCRLGGTVLGGPFYGAQAPATARPGCRWNHLSSTLNSGGTGGAHQPRHPHLSLAAGRCGGAAGAAGAADPEGPVGRGPCSWCLCKPLSTIGGASAGALGPAEPVARLPESWAMSTWASLCWSPQVRGEAGWPPGPEHITEGAAASEAAERAGQQPGQ